MAALGINTVRLYTPPRLDLLDEAGRHGLRVMVGLPWSQHVAFLDDRATNRTIRTQIVATVRELGIHPAVADVRARQRDSARRRPLARPSARRAIPARPLRAREGCGARASVHVRELPADRISRSVVLRRLRVQRLPAPRTRAARVSRAAAAHRRAQAAAARRSGRRQHPRRRRRARRRSPRCTSARRSRRAPAARSRSRGPTSGGAAGIAVEDWDFGLVDRHRAARSRRRRRWRRRSPTRRSRRRAAARWPRVSVVVCAYNAADTLEDCLDLARAADVSRLRDHRRQRRLARSHRRDRPRARRRPRRSTFRTAASARPATSASRRRPARSSPTRTPIPASIATG